MKATFDLPDELVRQLKLRAARDGRKLKDIAASLLREGLGASTHQKKTARPIVRKDRKTGLARHPMSSRGIARRGADAAARGQNRASRKLSGAREPAGYECLAGAGPVEARVSSSRA